MVSECANPRCREPFVYYRHGKLFSVPRRSAGVASKATVEHFWLCDICAKSMAIEVRHSGNPLLVTRRPIGNMLQLEYLL